MIYTFYPQKNKILFTLVGLFLSLNLLSKNKNIDSLLTLIKTDKADTNKVKHLIELGTRLQQPKPDTAIILYNQALGILKHYSDSLQNKQRIIIFLAKTYGNLGYCHLTSSDYSRALDYYFKALTLYEILKNKKEIANLYNSIGLTYDYLGNYSKSLDYYFKSLKISEEFENKKAIAKTLNLIGIVYYEQADAKEDTSQKAKFYAKTLDYYFQSLKIAEELGDKHNMQQSMGNIGIVYRNQGNYTKALDYYFKALEIAEKLGDSEAIASHFSNIGSTLAGQKKYSLALNFFSKAKNYFEEQRDIYGVANLSGNIGALYMEQKNYRKAYNYLYESLSANIKIGAKRDVGDAYKTLSGLYANTDTALPDSVGGKISNIEQTRLRSLYYYKRYVSIKDLLFNEENEKQMVQKEMNYEFEKKEAAIKLENEKQQAVAEEKNRKQKIITWTIAAGLLLVLFFTGFILRSLKITRKQKQIIEIKNKQTEQQKKIIEEKNKDITDSIHYAKRIQNALLREEEHVSPHLPEHFILFLPKDIVSGDFYWGTEKQDFWYFAVADCTGHGVPGAIMSMLGISFLNDIVLSDESPCPAEILNRLRAKVIKELRQTDESIENRDGMDISFARLNIKTLKLQWAGANNPLHLIRKGELEKVKPDKQPIGYHLASKPFTNHEIQLQSGDSVYIYSDGYADQFGGPQGKKLGYKKLENLFLIHNHKTMKEQKDIFKDRFNEWKGLLEQTDDVCVFGVRV